MLGCPARDVVAVKPDRARPRAKQASEGVHQRRLAGAVGAENRKRPALLESERHPFQNLRLAVPDDEILDFEQH